MARTPNKTTAPAGLPELLPAVTARIEAAQDSAITVAEAGDIYALGEAAGSAKAFGFLATVATSAEIAQYEKVKKSKAWKLLAVPGLATHRHFESLEEYCEAAFGKSYRRMRELSSNLRALGEDSYEQAERLGLRQIDYNAIKALPAPEQEIVRRAVEEAESREQVLDLLQELASHNAKEREALTKKADDAKADQAATEKRLEVVSQQRDDAERRAAQIAVMPPDEQLVELQREAGDVLAQAQGMVRGQFRAALIALQNHAEDNGQSMAGMVAQLQADLIALRDEFNLPDVVGDGTPAWMQWNRAQQAESAAAPN